MESKIFNSKILDFRLFSEDNAGTIDVIRDRNILDIINQPARITKLLYNGIRMENGPNKFTCVICGIPIKDLEQAADDHIDSEHQEKKVCQLLQSTPLKPVVGLSDIIEYRDERDEIVEIECTICKLFFSPITIIWHVLSIHHKQKYFKKYGEESLIIFIAGTREERIDQLLKHSDKVYNRGAFQRKTFRPWMVASARKFLNREKLNIGYLKKLYPNEEKRLGKMSCIPNLPRDITSYLDIKLNEQKFEKAKQLVIKMNQSLSSYKHSMKVPSRRNQ